MSSAARTEPHSILIVEDDADIREVLGAFLELRGCKILLAADGQEALDLLAAATRNPSFILLDLTMPGMNGVEFRAAQERDPRFSEIPIVVMSAHPDMREKADLIHATASLKKPIETEALVGLIARFCPNGA